MQTHTDTFENTFLFYVKIYHNNLYKSLISWEKRHILYHQKFYCRSEKNFVSLVAPHQYTQSLSASTCIANMDRDTDRGARIGIAKFTKAINAYSRGERRYAGNADRIACHRKIFAVAMASIVGETWKYPRKSTVTSESRISFHLYYENEILRWYTWNVHYICKYV